MSFSICSRRSLVRESWPRVALRARTGAAIRGAAPSATPMGPAFASFWEGALGTGRGLGTGAAFSALGALTGLGFSALGAFFFLPLAASAAAAASASAAAAAASASILSSFLDFFWGFSALGSLGALGAFAFFSGFACTGSGAGAGVRSRPPRSRSYPLAEILVEAENGWRTAEKGTNAAAPLMARAATTVVAENFMVPSQVVAG